MIGAVKQFINVTFRITTQTTCISPGNCNTTLQQITCRTTENPDRCPEEEEEGGIYIAVLELQNLQFTFYSTAADTICTPSHQGQVRWSFVNANFTGLKGFLICILPSLALNHFIHHPPTPPSPRLIIYHTLDRQWYYKENNFYFYI